MEKCGILHDITWVIPPRGCFRWRCGRLELMDVSSTSAEDTSPPPGLRQASARPRGRILSLDCHVGPISSWKLLLEAACLLRAASRDGGAEILKRSCWCFCAGLYVPGADSVNLHGSTFPWCWFWSAPVQIWHMLRWDSSPPVRKGVRSLWLVVLTVTEMSSFCLWLQFTHHYRLTSGY